MAQKILVETPGQRYDDVGHITDLGSLGAIFHETAKNILSWYCHGVVIV